MISIDLGSNTIRIVKFDCKTKEVLDSFEKIVGTAKGMHISGAIDDEAIQRIIKGLNEGKEKIVFENKIVATATAALRNAKNQKEVLNRIRQECGVDFQIISGEDEAYYTALGISNRLQKLNIEDPFVFIDIGGGSTEIGFFGKDNFISKSFDVGIVSISQKYSSIEGIRGVLPKLFADAKEFMRDARSGLGFRPSLFCATAGTPTTIAALKLGMNHKNYDPTKVNGAILNVDDLKKHLNILLKMDNVKREELVGTGRADLIIAGVLIFEELFSMTDFYECIVIDDGLREGVAISHCKGL